ncbi:TPA: hypothetical protein ACSPOR_004685 [Bacillus cereus]|uniref:hypothetical protein n=1 Tax=Bacillus cereus TaxID=1396 RepID=UPI00065B4D47|nr:hypothetical protein [Bacillus cereus]KMQ22189.1 hypothetical protein TU58_30555 [Bacillus cereus]
MEVDYFNALFMGIRKQEERKFQMFNECKYIFINIIERKSIIQKILEDMDPVIKETLSKLLISSCSIEEYLTPSTWVDWVLDLNWSVGLFNGYRQGEYLSRVIKELSRIRVELESIELKTIYIENLLLFIVEETRQFKLLAKSKHWTNEKYRNEIINHIKNIIMVKEKIDKEIVH